MKFTPAAPITESVNTSVVGIQQVVLNPVAKTVTIYVDRIDSLGNRMSSVPVSLVGAQAQTFMGVQISTVTLAQVFTKACAAAVANIFGIASPTVTVSADQDLAAP